METTSDPSAGVVTVADGFDAWIKARSPRWAPSTIVTHRYIATRVNAHIGKVPLADVTTQMLDGIYLDLGEGRVRGHAGAAGPLGPASVHRIHASVGAMLHQARKWGLIPTTASTRASPPRALPHRGRALDPESLMTIVR